MPVKEEAPWGILEFGLIMAQGGPQPKPNYYGCIYYSPEFYSWGWVSNYVSRDAAESDVRNACPHGGGGQVLWARNAWMALAVADDGSYGAAYSLIRKKKGYDMAVREAIRACPGPNPRVVLVFDSSLTTRGGGTDPRAPRIKTAAEIVAERLAADNAQYAAWAQDYARKARARGYTGPIRSGKRCMWCGSYACLGDSAHPGATI
jgi:hypothetical protein